MVEGSAPIPAADHAEALRSLGVARLTVKAQGHGLT